MISGLLPDYSRTHPTFLAIHSHYQKVAQQLRLYEGIEKRTYDGNLVLVLVGNVTRVSVGAINYAQSIGDEVLAMHISTKETAEKDQENSPRILPITSQPLL